MGNPKYKFNTARFHQDHGPVSLFERILFKMSDGRELKFHANHFRERKDTREIEDDITLALKNFNRQDWSLMTAEVRTDTGKFINSTWEKEFSSGRIWITIGFGDTIQTIIRKDSSGKGYQYVIDGPLYEFVDTVNRELMNQEQ